MSRLITQLAAGLLLAPALLTAPVAQAHQTGDILLRAGAITVDPQEDSSEIRLVGAPLTDTRATLDSDTQLGLNFAFMLTDHFALELLAATPFSHDVGVKGLGGLDGRLGSIRHLPPTVSAIWYPLQPGSAFQPYLGGGVNYTFFFDEGLSSRAERNGFDGLELDDSWGLAVQLGADYMLTDKLMLNAQMRYIDIDTEGSTSLGGAAVDVDVEVDPLVYMLGLGYRF